MTKPSRVASALLQNPIAIVASALLLRLVWAWLVPVVPVSDSVMYEAFARSIAQGHGYAYPDGQLTSYWAVGASAAYAVLYATFDQPRLWVAVAQALLGAFIVGLTWRLARTRLDARGAALSAWIVALWPTLIAFTTILASELLFIALMLLALNVWISRHWPLVLRAVLWGAFIAGATYVRPTAWPLLLVFPTLQCLLDGRRREALAMAVVSVTTAAALFAPWVHRNFSLYGQFVLVATNGGPNLWMGNNPLSNGGYMPLPERTFATEAARDRELGRDAMAYIREHPGDYVRLSLRRAVMTYDRESIGVVWNETGLRDRFGARVIQPLKLLASAYWWVVLAGGVAGAACALWRARPLPWPELAALMYFAVVPILTVGQDRYHLPIDPLLALFAAWGATLLVWRVPDRRATPRWLAVRSWQRPGSGRSTERGG